MRPERFWKRVEKTESCWLWHGNRDPRGYGRVRLNGRNGPRTMAHRYAYQLIVGPIPKGLVLDHLCRVPECVNPAHLEPVTDRVNVLRGVGPAATNAQKTHCIHGHLLDEANTYVYSGGRRRHCKTCVLERTRIARLAEKQSFTSQTVGHSLSSVAGLAAPNAPGALRPLSAGPGQPFSSKGAL